MWAQLTKACLRLEEIETQLSQPETYDDPDLAASLNKEQKDLLPLVEAYRQHQKAQSDLDGLADLLDDPECRQLAKAEETALRAELDRLEEELRLLLQPKDPWTGKMFSWRSGRASGARKRRCLPRTSSACTPCTAKSRAGGWS